MRGKRKIENKFAVQFEFSPHFFLVNDNKSGYAQWEKRKGNNILQYFKLKIQLQSFFFDRLKVSKQIIKFS
jgi:hypothetical protein